MNTQPTKKVKVALLGDAGVGKSSIVQRIFRNEFYEFQEATIGAAYMVMTRDDTRLECWDTAGQERYRSLISMYTRSADVVWLVVDASDENRQEQIDYWIQTVKNSIPETATIVRIINKVDLVRERPLMYRRENSPVFYTSAKTGEGCDELLEYTFTKTVSNTGDNNKTVHRISIGSVEPPPPNSYCCSVQ